MALFYTLLKILLRIDSRLINLTGLLQLLLEHQQSIQQVSMSVNWLDNQDVMFKLKISESTLRRRRLDGIIPSTRIRGKFYYKESDIQALLRRDWS